MQNNKALCWLCCILLIGSTIAAPIAEQTAKENKDTADNQGNNEKVEDQEKELESLVALAEKPAKSNMENVAVQKSHVVHYENKNGKEIKTEQTEEKVTDTETGKVLSDIKQKADTGLDETGKPETLVETKVDIPDKDIHKSFFDKEISDDGSEIRDSLHGIEFTPTAIAEYLYKTWDFNNFYKALEELVDSGMMTAEEAAKYEEDVISEYRRVSHDYTGYVEEFPTRDLQGYDEDDEVDKRSMSYPDELYNEYYRGNMLGENDRFEPTDVQTDSLSEPQSVESALDELLEEWWVQAFEAGEPRAQALVKFLYETVAHDDDPDDLGQIKEILADMLEKALVEDLGIQQTSNDLNSIEENMNEESATVKRSQAQTASEENEQAPSVDENAKSEEETPSKETEAKEKENSEDQKLRKTEEEKEKNEGEPPMVKKDISQMIM